LQALSSQQSAFSQSRFTAKDAKGAKGKHKKKDSGGWAVRDLCIQGLENRFWLNAEC
jgi:hypothetical protein